MSYSSVVRLDEQSDSRILIDACLARVRQEAGLDVEPVLPPLHVLLGDQPSPPSKKMVLVSESAQQLPSAEAIVRSMRPRSATTARIARAEVARALARKARWPVFLCGFIGGIFGGIAVMKSPLGDAPAVQHVVKTVQSHARGVYAAAAGATSRIVNR